MSQYYASPAASYFSVSPDVPLAQTIETIFLLPSQRPDSTEVDTLWDDVNPEVITANMICDPASFIEKFRDQLIILVRAC